MYKKIVLFSLLFFTAREYASDVTPWIEIKPSYFFFVDSPINEIYDDGGFQVQGSVSFPLCNHLDFYSSIGYRQAWGHALNSLEETNIKVVPFDVGLKPVFNFSEKFYYFFAGGPRFFFFQQNNDSLYVNSIVQGGGIGFFVNTGFNVIIADHFLLGIFGEYSYENKAMNGVNSENILSNGLVQIGGLAFGINLGYAF